MTPPGGVRRAVLADLDALLALEQLFPGDRISRPSWRNFITRAHADVWVVEQGGRVVADALVSYRRGSRVARLYSIVVHPEARGQGVATALLRACEEAARLLGCSAMLLEVREDNAAAIALYQRQGYMQEGLEADYYQDHTAALHMRKTLAQPSEGLERHPFQS